MTEENDKQVDIDFSAAERDLLDKEYQDAVKERTRAGRNGSPGFRSPKKILLWGGGAFVFFLLLAFFFTGKNNAPDEGERAALQGRLQEMEVRLDALASQSEDAIRYLREEVYTLTKKMESLEKKPEAAAAQKAEKKEPRAAAADKPKASSEPAAAQKFHTVRRGDTLYGIARNYGLAVKELAELNGIPLNKAIHPGEKLIVR